MSEYPVVEPTTPPVVAAPRGMAAVGSTSSFALTLVLRAQPGDRLAPVAVADGLAKVFDDEGAAAAENLDALLAHRAVALGEVGD